MPQLSRQQLAARRAERRARDQRRHRRLLIRGSAPVLALAIVGGAIAAGFATFRGSESQAAIVPLTSASTSGEPRPPQDIEIATAGTVSLRLPIERSLVTAIAFRAVDNPLAIAMVRSGEIDSNVMPPNGRPGPDTGSVDIGAAATTPVYSPVDGVVRAINRYRIVGTDQGYELVIAPNTAADRAVHITHLDAHGVRPTVGQPVAKGQTIVGQVRDFTAPGLPPQDISRYTADRGNHVHIEVVRTSIIGSGA